MPAGRVLAGGELHGPLPRRLPHGQGAAAAPRRRLPLPRVETQRDQPRHGRQARPLHRPLHHLRPALGPLPFWFKFRCHL